MRQEAKKHRLAAPSPSAAMTEAEAAISVIQELQQQAMTAYRTGRLRVALEACRAILVRQPNRADVLSFAGMIATQLGQLEDAVEYYSDAVAIKPDFADAHYNLAIALQRLGRLPDAVAAYRRALSEKPTFGAARHNLGSVLRDLGDLDGAIECFGNALSLGGGAESAFSLGSALQAAARPGEAVDAFRRAVTLKPDWPSAHSHLIHALMKHGDLRAAVDECESWLAVDRASVEAQALKAILLNESGDEKAARFILDFDRFVRVVDFEAPPAYASLADFNAALVRAVESHPTLKVPPTDHPTYHHPALQITEELLGEPSGPMADFERMVYHAIAGYLAAVPREPPHPFLVNFPRQWRLTAWATRLAGEGNLVPHIHHDGYLGGVYYPLLPKVVSETGRGEAGWFELGRPPAILHTEAPPIVRRIQPKEGRMLLFPGYFFHNTVPFTSTERRISIAWDLIAQP
ncbi:MAG TPA: tetratricopeptide repeat protein [Alphaproteobacteria bacterium]|nr:tetratricopeptide repeat protein [Alphaproteobacteria bacterium]